MLCVLGPAWNLLLWKCLLGVWPSGKPRCLGRGEWRAVCRVEMGVLALPKDAPGVVGGGGVVSHGAVQAGQSQRCLPPWVLAVSMFPLRGVPQ